IAIISFFVLLMLGIADGLFSDYNTYNTY
ncbi:hypothetical protein P8838_17145, partial [Bacillus spizizenii]|nr:hypothetical protein [Bacillus spizizenii]